MLQGPSNVVQIVIGTRSDANLARLHAIVLQLFKNRLYMRHILLHGSRLDDVRHITMSQRPVTAQRVRVAIQVIDSTSFELSAGPLTDFVGGSVIHLQVTAAAANFDTHSAKHDFVPVDTLVSVTNNKQVVFGFPYCRSDKLKAGVANVLSFIHHHGTNTQCWLLLP
ncbi:hypothetical protein D3C86_1579700 [compost metagenome]